MPPAPYPARKGLVRASVPPPFLTPAERGRGQRSAANPTARVQTPISESGMIPIFEAGRNGVPQPGAEEIPPASQKAVMAVLRTVSVTPQRLTGLNAFPNFKNRALPSVKL